MKTDSRKSLPIRYDKTKECLHTGGNLLFRLNFLEIYKSRIDPHSQKVIHLAYPKK